jgi:hypothetical protein
MRYARIAMSFPFPHFTGPGDACICIKELQARYDILIKFYNQLQNSRLPK